MARRRVAVVDRDVAEQTRVALGTIAAEADARQTVAIALTARRIATKIVGHRTILADVAERTRAHVLVSRRQTLATISTRHRTANVNQNRTVLALKAGHAVARVRVEVARANGAVLARSRQTIVQYDVAERARPARLTIANEAHLRRRHWDAEAVDARLILARIECDLTVLADVATLTIASVRVDVVDARGIVGAQIVLAVVHLNVAVGSLEAGRTATGLVEASATVVASAIAEQIVRTFGVDLGRDDFGVAVRAEPIGAANSHARRVASPMTIDAVV